MVYITGDIHGETYHVTNAVRAYGITGSDCIVLLGDVGLNYSGDPLEERYHKRQLNRLGIPIICIHGNHEMRPETIDSYREVQWHGGIVYIEEEFANLMFAKDGEIFDLEGQKAIAIGGAYSVDKWYRLRRGYRWFSDEQPSDAVKARVELKLAELNWNVDIVLTHTCPERYTPIEAFLPGVDQSTVDISTERWLDSIAERLTYRSWYCGHWHIDKHIDKMHFLFHSWTTTTDELDVER